MVFNHPVKNFGGLTLFFLRRFQGLMEQSNAICWFPGDDVFCWKETFGRTREMYFGVPDRPKRGAMLGANVMVKADFSCLSCGGFFGAFIKNLALFCFFKNECLPIHLPQKKPPGFVFPHPSFSSSRLRGTTRRKPPRARCVQPSVTMERSWSTSMEIDAWLDDFGPYDKDTVGDRWMGGSGIHWCYI